MTSRSCDYAAVRMVGDRGPARECLVTGGTECDGNVVISAAGKTSVAVRATEALDLPRRFEPLRDPHFVAGVGGWEFSVWLLETFVLWALELRRDLPLGRPIALQSCRL
jgi:hypothetical protein